MPLVLYLFVLKTLSLQSELPVPEFLLSDKIYHAAAFTLLGFLWARAFKSLFSIPRFFLVAVAFWGSFLYGVIDEFLIQASTPGRFPSGWDLGADVVGAVLGGLLFVWKIGWQKRLWSSRTTA